MDRGKMVLRDNAPDIKSSYVNLEKFPEYLKSGSTCFFPVTMRF